jgi:hypothetical protein
LPLSSNLQCPNLPSRASKKGTLAAWCRSRSPSIWPAWGERNVGAQAPGLDLVALVSGSFNEDFDTFDAAEAKAIASLAVLGRDAPDGVS